MAAGAVPDPALGMASRPQHGVAVWSSASWLAAAVAWLDERLAAAGIGRTGAVERARGWIVLPDGGPSLGERREGPELVAALVAALDGPVAAWCERLGRSPVPDGRRRTRRSRASRIG